MRYFLMSQIYFRGSRWKGKAREKPRRGKDGGIGQNGVGILRCHSEEFNKGGIFGGDQATSGV